MILSPEMLRFLPMLMQAGKMGAAGDKSALMSGLMAGAIPALVAKQGAVKNLPPIIADDPRAGGIDGGLGLPMASGK